MRKIKVPELVEGSAKVTFVKGFMKTFDGPDTDALEIVIEISREMEEKLSNFYPDAPMRYIHIKGIWEGLIVQN